MDTRPEVWTEGLVKNLKEIENSVNKVGEALQSFGNSIKDVFNNIIGEAFGTLIDDLLEPLKLKIKEGENAFVKFGKTVVNNIINMIAQTITEGMVFLGTLTLMNLIVPGSGTAFAAILGGGGNIGAFKSIFGFGRGIRAPGKQSGGPLEEGLFMGHSGEYVLNARQTRNLGTLLDNFTRFISGAQPRFAAAGALSTPVVIEYHGEAAQALGAMVNVVQKAPGQLKRRFGEETLSAQDLEIQR